MLCALLTEPSTSHDSSLLLLIHADFNEFDGGDGQMGVAGDGQAGLEKMDNVPMMGSSVLKSLDKSKMMSAKNAWGTSTGYADELLQKNPKMDISRAQQLENWQNQQEVRRKTQQQQDMSEQYGQANWDEEENWRSLAKFGVDRNQVSVMTQITNMCFLLVLCWYYLCSYSNHFILVLHCAIPTNIFPYAGL